MKLKTYSECVKLREVESGVFGPSGIDGDSICVFVDSDGNVKTIENVIGPDGEELVKIKLFYDEGLPGMTLAEIRSVRCFNCRRFAYTDLFKGEQGPCGYVCRECVDLIEGKFK